MKLSYKRLGDYIQPCDEKNEGNQVDLLQGISNQKFFQKAKTNTIGVDLSKYRIVRTGQFAFNRATTRNGDKISIALRQAEDCIVSPSYRIFKSIDENVLDSEYLMMWFRRPEFDRYARFKSHGSAHEFFDWEEMCEVELPIPSIEKQREIVAEYNTVVNRIKLNEQLNQKLEETAQALYKHWFVDFEFPISAEQAAEMGNPNLEGKPYKSSGGKMVFNEELEKEIPEGWGKSNLAEITLKITDGTHSTVIDDPRGEFHLLSCKNIKNNTIQVTDKDRRINKTTLDFLRKRTGLQKNDILITTVGSIGEVAQIKSDHIPYELQRSVAILRSDESHISNQYLYQFVKGSWFKEQVADKVSGSVQRCLFLKPIGEIELLIPYEPLLKSFNEIVDRLQEVIGNSNLDSLRCSELRTLLLSKMTQVELEKEIA